MSNRKSFCGQDYIQLWQQGMLSHARAAWIDILKGIGIILVVIGHINSNNVIFNWIYSFHMPLFFLAGGLVYRKKPIWEDVKRRIHTIVIPYLSFGFLVLIYWQLIERQFRKSDMTFIDSFIGLLSGEYRYLDFNVHLWFLPCFFLNVLLFNILVNVGDKIGKNKDGIKGEKLFAYVVAAMMSVIQVFIDLPDMPWGADRVFMYIGFYAVGVALHGYKMDEAVKKKVRDKRGTAIVIATFFLAINFILAYIGVDTGFMRFVTALIGVVAVGIIAIVIDHNKVLEYFGRISLVVLCVHGPVYRVCVKLVSILLRITTDDLRENFVFVLFVVGMTLLVCAVVYEIVVRVAPWMTHGVSLKM